MDVLPLLVIAVVGIVLVVFIIARQRSEYGKQLHQLDPKKDKKPREFGIYTIEEVAKHDKPSDAWIIVRHKESQEYRVYNITDYVDEHPGGESILRNIGRDATEGVYGPQHPITTFLLMDEYCIGKLAEGEEAKLGR